MKRLLLLSLWTATSWGCLHFDREIKYEIVEGVKTAFLFHDGKSAHLIVKTELVAPAGKLPAEIAWVMPFPTLPSKYEEVDGALFDELQKLVTPPSKGYGNARGKGIKGDAAIKVHDTQVVGNYRIQPIEILTPNDGKELNAWLEENRFNAMPFELQKQYLKKGAVFLAIRAKLTGAEADLKPIHIVYSASTMSFPLKFTHDTRTFGIDLFVMSTKPVDEKTLRASYLATETGHAWKQSATMPHLARLLKKQRGTVTKIVGRDLNTPEKRLSALADDPTFRP